MNPCEVIRGRSFMGGHLWEVIRERSFVEGHLLQVVCCNFLQTIEPFLYVLCSLLRR